MKQHKVIHHRAKCIGCNSCITLAPQSWIMDEKDGKARLVCSKQKKDLFIADIFDQDLEDNINAAEACPMRIIKVQESK